MISINKKIKNNLLFPLIFLIGSCNSSDGSSESSSESSDVPIKVTNFELKTFYKVYSPSFAGTNLEPVLDEFILIYGADITNVSGEPIIDFDGITPLNRHQKGSLLYSNFLLNNFNGLGDNKELISGKAYLFDDSIGIKSDFSDEQPWLPNKTYQLYWYYDLSKKPTNGDKNFYEYFSSDATFEPQLVWGLLGGTPSNKTKYWYTLFCAGNESGASDITDLRECVKTILNNPANDIIWNKSSQYSQTKLSTNPFQGIVNINDKMPTPYEMMCKLLNLKEYEEFGVAGFKIPQ